MVQPSLAQSTWWLWQCWNCTNQRMLQLPFLAVNKTSYSMGDHYRSPVLYMRFAQMMWHLVRPVPKGYLMPGSHIQAACFLHACCNTGVYILHMHNARMQAACIIAYETWIPVFSKLFMACVKAINDWMLSSRLKLNPTKTKVLWLGSSQQLSQISIINIPLQSTTIRVEEFARDLGVIIEGVCTTKHHSITFGTLFQWLNANCVRARRRRRQSTKRGRRWADVVFTDTTLLTLSCRCRHTWRLFAVLVSSIYANSAQCSDH